jgi:hypothetical protein
MADIAASAPAEIAPKRLFSEGYKRTVLGILTTVYTLNFVDRTIVGIIGQPMKESLGITDNQLGLLTGFAFAALYTVLGVPIARLAERVSRTSRRCWRCGSASASAKPAARRRRTH